MAVASETGTSALALMDEPYWGTLWQFHLLCERDERMALVRRVERVDGGVLAAIARHQPGRLTDEVEAAHHALVSLDFPADPADEVATLRAKATAMAARIESGKTLTDGALLA